MLPPVIILNLSYSGLGIARDLAGRGIRLVGFSADRKVYGNFTRLTQQAGDQKSLIKDDPAELNFKVKLKTGTMVLQMHIV